MRVIGTNVLPLRSRTLGCDTLLEDVGADTGMLGILPDTTKIVQMFKKNQNGQRRGLELKFPNFQNTPKRPLFSRSQN